MNRALAAFALAGAAFVLVAPPAGATNPHNDEHLVTICHAKPAYTAANGYVQITVDVASVGYQHSGHQAKHADIIPPYSYGNYSYPGKGDQAILANGCVVPEQPPTTTTTVPTPPPTDPPVEPPVPPVEPPVEPPTPPVEPPVVTPPPVTVELPPAEATSTDEPRASNGATFGHTGAEATLAAIGFGLVAAGIVLRTISKIRHAG